MVSLHIQDNSKIATGNVTPRSREKEVKDLKLETKHNKFL